MGNNWPGGGCGCGCNGTNASCSTQPQGMKKMAANYNDPAYMAQQMMAAAQQVCNQANDAMSRMNSGLVGGGMGPINAYSPAPFGWDSVRAEDCYRTNSQRQMSPDVRLMGATTNVAGAAADVWGALLTALGIPAAGTVLNVFLATNNVALNRLALVALLAKVSVSITPAAAGDNFDSDSAAVALKNLLGSFLGLGVTTNDQTENWVAPTALDYWFPQGSNDYRRIPGIVFRQTENQAVQLQRLLTNVPGVAAAAPTFFVPNNVRVEAMIHIKGIWMAHPSCGCTWPGNLCGDPNKIVWQPGDMNQNGGNGGNVGVSTPAGSGTSQFGQGYI